MPTMDIFRQASSIGGELGPEPTIIAIVSTASGVIRAWWEVSFSGQIEYQYPSGIVLPPGFEPSACIATAGSGVVAVGTALSLRCAGGLNSGSKVVLRGYLSPN